MVEGRIEPSTQMRQIYSLLPLTTRPPLPKINNLHLKDKLIIYKIYTTFIIYRKVLFAITTNYFNFIEIIAIKINQNNFLICSPLLYLMWCNANLLVELANVSFEPNYINLMLF